jgi:uncharacterized metal-binding protein
MNSNTTQCECSAAPKLIFACSGASDTGETADRAARALTKDGAGRMYCLAGLGGQVQGIICNTQSASRILAIDGCPTECAKKTLQVAGFTAFEHIQLADIGLPKGSSPATAENIQTVVAKAKELLEC